MIGDRCTSQEISFIYLHNLTAISILSLHLHFSGIFCLKFFRWRKQQRETCTARAAGKGPAQPTCRVQLAHDISSDRRLLRAKQQKRHERSPVQPHDPGM